MERGVHGFPQDGGNYQIFTASGTFIVPSGVKVVYVSGIGGGGGGAGAAVSVATSGGPGQSIMDYPVAVTPNEAVPIAIGAGGAAGTAAPTDGSDGGSTSFGSYLTLAGGKKGRASGSYSQTYGAMINNGFPNAPDIYGQRGIGVNDYGAGGYVPGSNTTAAGGVGQPGILWVRW